MAEAHHSRMEEPHFFLLSGDESLYSRYIYYGTVKRRMQMEFAWKLAISDRKRHDQMQKNGRERKMEAIHDKKMSQNQKKGCCDSFALVYDKRLSIQRKFR